MTTSKEEVFSRLREQFQAPVENFKVSKTSSGIPELDDILKGGWSSGLSFIEGPHGIGKSLLCAITANKYIEENHQPVLIADSDNSYALWAKYLDYLPQALKIIPQHNSLFSKAPTFSGVGKSISQAFEQHHIPDLVIIESLDSLLSENEEKNHDIHYSMGSQVQQIRNQELQAFLHDMRVLSLSHKVPFLITRQSYNPESVFMRKDCEMDSSEGTNIDITLSQEKKDTHHIIKQSATTHLIISMAEQSDDQGIMPEQTFLSVGRTLDSIRGPSGLILRQIDFTSHRDNPNSPVDGFYIDISTPINKRGPRVDKKTIQIPFEIFNNQFSPKQTPEVFKHLNSHWLLPWLEDLYEPNLPNFATSSRDIVDFANFD